ncbi:MAG: peroxiredoxin-like family protein [Marinilabilia sp.]
MKKYILLAIIAFLAASTNAQLPQKAEDISPLLFGETIPDVALTATDGTQHQLYSVIKEKPTVLLFYRGGWCPYCNQHLAEIQDVEDEVTQLGYQIVGISPDSPENLQNTDEEKELNYRLFSDGEGKLSKAVGIAYQGPEKYGDMLKKSSDGLNDEGFLPVPAVFVVDDQGVIHFEYINPDYTTRLSGELLLAVLKTLKFDQ